MNHIIVGTAGHIDHGKTALIEAMSGYNGDELEEEKKRGITIDLSFSNISNAKTNIAFIDVPGHEKLIKNMISGAFGFDVSLFVIDVNEGIMPQTIEHLEVLNFLNVNNIIIALSKCDLCDEYLIEKRKQEIIKYLKEYKNLNILGIFATSIKDKNSIKKLKDFLFDLEFEKEKSNEKFFRYYIDRVFSIKGYGEVTTGTVLNGSIEIDKKVYACELNQDITVKNIQIHGQDSKVALKHQRAALNLNIPHGKLKKGFLLTNKGYFRGFNSIDVFIKIAKNKEIQHNNYVQFLCGTKSLTAKIHLYSNESIDNGIFAKIIFDEKVYLMHEDRFIILLNNSIAGGGIILDPINDPIKKSKKLPLLKSLYKKEYKNAFSELTKNHKKGFGLISSIQRFALSHDEALALALEIDEVYVDEKELVLYPKSSQELIKNSIKTIYEKNHYALLSPLSLNLRMKWASESFIKTVLDNFVKSGFLEISNNIYKRVDVGEIDIEKELGDKIYSILNNLEFAPIAPYNLYDNIDIDRKLGDKILKKLTSNKKIVRIAHNLFITSINLSKILQLQKNIIKDEGYIDLKNFRKRVNLSRKYLIGYLEYLDKLDEIKKEGTRRYFR